MRAHRAPLPEKMGRQRAFTPGTRARGRVRPRRARSASARAGCARPRRRARAAGLGTAPRHGSHARPPGHRSRRPSRARRAPRGPALGLDTMSTTAPRVRRPYRCAVGSRASHARFGSHSRAMADFTRRKNSAKRKRRVWPSRPPPRHPEAARRAPRRVARTSTRSGGGAGRIGLPCARRPLPPSARVPVLRRRRTGPWTQRRHRGRARARDARGHRVLGGLPCCGRASPAGRGRVGRPVLAALRQALRALRPGCCARERRVPAALPRVARLHVATGAAVVMEPPALRRPGVRRRRRGDDLAARVRPPRALARGGTRRGRRLRRWINRPPVYRAVRPPALSGDGGEPDARGGRAPGRERERTRGVERRERRRVHRQGHDQRSDRADRRPLARSAPFRA